MKKLCHLYHQFTSDFNQLFLNANFSHLISEKKLREKLGDSKPSAALMNEPYRVDAK